MKRALNREMSEKRTDPKQLAEDIMELGTVCPLPDSPFVSCSHAHRRAYCRHCGKLSLRVSWAVVARRAAEGFADEGGGDATQVHD